MVQQASDTIRKWLVASTMHLAYSSVLQHSGFLLSMTISAFAGTVKSSQQEDNFSMLCHQSVLSNRVLPSNMVGSQDQWRQQLVSFGASGAPLAAN